MITAKHNTWAKGKERRQLYAIWRGMHERCKNPARPDFARYGASGITVCERWDEFSAFLEDMGPRPEGRRSIDRVDGSLGYDPSNCRWASAVEQARNKTTNHVIQWSGQTHCIAKWSEVTGLSAHLIKFRLRDGWPVEKALTTPLQQGRTPACRNGHIRTEQNTHMSSGSLICRDCNSLAVARYKAARRASTGASQ